MFVCLQLIAMPFSFKLLNMLHEFLNFNKMINGMWNLSLSAFCTKTKTQRQDMWPLIYKRYHILQCGDLQYIFVSGCDLLNIRKWGQI